MLRITRSSSPQEITEEIKRLREQKGKEKEVLNIIHKARVFGEDFLVDLFWEEALVYQHLLMNADGKGEAEDKIIRKKNLIEMEKTVKLAKYFIVRYDLYRWSHRLYRFMGRVEDFKGNYNRALNYYRKALKYAREDPDYAKDKLPRWLEVEAFISFSLIMKGGVSKGYKLALEIFDKFDHDKEARQLKINDYSTWAIWKSGIPIRTINALLDKKAIFNKMEGLSLLEEAESILNPPKGIKAWVDFSYRKEEIEAVLKRLDGSSN